MKNRLFVKKEKFGAKISFFYLFTQITKNIGLA
jgi:hypothetical protein